MKHMDHNTIGHREQVTESGGLRGNDESMTVLAFESTQGIKQRGRSGYPRDTVNSS